MEKEEIGEIAQLLTGMKDAVRKIEDAKKRKDEEMLKIAKKEILEFQKQIDKKIK